MYLASIDILSANANQVIAFIEKHVPGIVLNHRTDTGAIPRHPSALADALYFLDTLEHFIPTLPQDVVYRHLPIIRTYIQLPSNPALRPHLESAHSVFLAILARGDMLQDQIPIYLNEVYTAFPSILSPRQVTLAFSTVIKLSSPVKANEIMTELLRHASTARAEPLQGGVDEQLTYLFAAVDSLRWLEVDVIEFWLEQIVFVARGLTGRRRENIVERLWECVSGEMGGDVGLTAVEWWVNGGKGKVMGAKL